MKFRQKIFTALTALSLMTAVVFWIQGTAQAAPTWCAVLQGGQSQCPGSLYSDGSPILNHLSDQSSSAGLKQSLVALVNQLAAGGNRQQRVGAAYVINGLGGADWTNRLSNPALVATIENYNTNIDPVNTAYNPASDSIVQYNEAMGLVKSLVFRNGAGGPIVYVIKWDCGNPLGNYGGPPPYVSNTPPSGSISISCSGGGGAVVSTSYSDPDGNPTVTVQYNGTHVSGPHDARSLNPWSIGAGDAAGSFTITLVVYDYGGSSHQTYTQTSGGCNAPPTGSINIACNSFAAGGGAVVTSSYSDPNGPTSATIRYNGTHVSGPYNAASLNPWNIGPGDAARSFTITLVVNDAGGSNHQTYTQSSSGCDTPATGTATIGCGGISGTAIDANQPGSQMTVYYYVYDMAGNLISIRGGGSSSTSGGSHAYSWGASLSNLTGNRSDWGSVQVQVVVDDLNTSSATGNRTAIGARQTLGPCAAISCTGASSTFAATQQVGVPDDFTVNIRVSGVESAPPNTYYFQIIVRNDAGAQQPLSGGTGPTPGRDYRFTYSSGVITSETGAGIAQFTPAAAGNYTVVWSFNGAGGAGCNDTAKAGFTPFFNVEAGDTTAGQGFGTSCTTGGATAGIRGFNMGSSGSFAGAGTRLGAFAMGEISGFATGQGTSILGLASTAPSRLSFANTGANDAAGIYGGSYFGASTGWCVADYAASTATSSTTDLPAGTVNLSTLTSGIYRATSDLTVSGVVPAGQKITIISSGFNVLIGGNITYAPYTSLADMPLFQLLVHDGGNIYVRSTATTHVDTLYGFYVAQPRLTPTKSGGNIYTCATAIGSPSSNYATCNHRLNVYGAFAADTVVMGRTYGNVVSAGGAPATSAEQFNFSPELWLQSALPPQDGAQNVLSNWQSVTSLPPVL